jgi:hypothetical protein
VTPAEVPPKAAGRGQAEEGQEETHSTVRADQT